MKGSLQLLNISSYLLQSFIIVCKLQQQVPFGVKSLTAVTLIVTFKESFSYIYDEMVI